MMKTSRITVKCKHRDEKQIEMKMMKRKIVARSLLVRATALAGAVALFATSILAYNGSNAVSYSDRHALNPSYLYSYYDGADCANFVSQCLMAGGMTTNSTWTMNSTAWINADALKNYLRDNNLATKIGSWSKNGTPEPYKTYAYIDNSANMTASDVGRVVVFYDWESDGIMNHAALFVANNSATWDSTADGNVTGDLINQHTKNRKRVIWNADKRNDRALYTRIYAFRIN